MNTPQPLDAKYRILSLHEDVAPLRGMGLEFQAKPGHWVPNGLIWGTINKTMLGRYRVSVDNLLNHPHPLSA
jgi:hypothetical protein